MELTFEDLAHELYTFRTETTGKGRDKVVKVQTIFSCICNSKKHKRSKYLKVVLDDEIY